MSSTANNSNPPTAEWFTSQITALGDVTLLGSAPSIFPIRKITMADGKEGDIFGEQGKGLDDPTLLVLEDLMKAKDKIKYKIRRNRSDSGNIIFISIDPAAAATAVAQRGATPKPPKESPFQEKVNQPKNPADDFPTTPPANQKTGQVKSDDDPWLGYGSRDAMFRAKDGHFERMERYKMTRDARNDREIKFQFYLRLAVDICKEFGKGLDPTTIPDVAWPIAVNMMNRYDTEIGNGKTSIEGSGS